MPSIVVTEIKATTLRHRFLRRLAGRTDIVSPAALLPSLAGALPRFLVAGLDDAREPGVGGWPVFTGGRYPKLCFSPVLDGTEREEGSAPLHPLPLTRVAYVYYVEAVTGIAQADFADVERIFRFDPVQIFDACASMRRECPAAWRLLLSNEFALAKRLWPPLGELIAGSRFQYPLVDAFTIVAELERACLIMRHLARTRSLIGRDRFLDILGSSLPLGSWFGPDELVEVCRWIEYATFSSAALTDLLFERDAAGVAALPPGYAPWAIARGRMIGAAADFHDHPDVRAAMIRVFARPPLFGQRSGQAEGRIVERRKHKLRNDEVVRFFGMTSEQLPVIALDDAAKAFPSGRVRNPTSVARCGVVKDHLRMVQASLGSALRRRGDPAMEAAVTAASAKHAQVSAGRVARDITREENVRSARHFAKTYLPAVGRLGAAARFDPTMWRTPTRDAALWKAIVDPRASLRHGLGRADARDLRAIARVMRRPFGRFFDGLIWSAEIERVACDLATGVSPIGVDPHIAYAVHALGSRR